MTRLDYVIDALSFLFAIGLTVAILFGAGAL